MFHRVRSWVLALALCVPVLAVPAVAVADPITDDHQVAVTCYGGSVPITLPANGYSGVYTTTSRCNDINLRIDAGGGQWVAVCWARHNTCQASWTWVPEDAGYRVIATDVLDGTTFYFVATGGGGGRTGRTAF